MESVPRESGNYIKQSLLDFKILNTNNEPFARHFHNILRHKNTLNGR